MRIYLTKQGDEWDRIAFERLGSEHLVDRLIALNPSHQSTVVFAAGVRLILPEVETRLQTFGPAPWREMSSIPPV